MLRLFWASLYEAPGRLDEKSGQQRLFAPESYRVVRERAVVPIVHSETLALSAFFPSCWRLEAGRFHYAVLRSLFADGTGHPVEPTHAGGALPLALKAYPLTVLGDEDQIVVDLAIADKPTDIGAPMLLPGGRASRAVTLRARMVASLRENLGLTEELTAALVAADLLEPWPLDLDLGGGRRALVEDLFVFRAARLGDPVVAGLVRRFGIEAGVLISAHRMSLFRIAALYRAARAEAARRAAA